MAEAVEVGLFTAEKAKAIRAEGESVIARVEAEAWPFDVNWSDWRPDPEWPLPRVPAGWDEI